MGAMIRHYLLNKNRGIVCATPRAGSVSMAEALAPMHHGEGAKSVLIKEEKVLHHRVHMPCYMWIRNPSDRILSAWTIWKMRKEISGPSDFVDLLLSTRNVHWTPQVELHTTKTGFFLPTVIYAFDTINETFPRATGCSMTPLNPGNHNAFEDWNWFLGCLSTEQISRLADRYEEDLRLWSDCFLMEEGLNVINA